MAVQVVSLVNYAITLLNPAYTLKPFENKIFTDLSTITSDLATHDSMKRLQAEVITPIDLDDGGGQAIVTAKSAIEADALVSRAGISLKTLAEMLAWAPADGTSCYVTDLYSGVRGLFAYHQASGKWRPTAMVLVDRSLTLDSGVNSTAEQYIKSLSIPAGLLFTGCEILFEYTLARSNTTDAGTTASFRIGNLGTISDAARGNGSGCASLTSTVRTYGNSYRLRVVGATQVEKVGAPTTSGAGFAAGGTSLAVGAWDVGDTTQRLYFAPTVQLAAATGSTLPQIGYCALWLLPS
jgi:hypothetical protein